jgi:hypothetical protein
MAATWEIRKVDGGWLYEELAGDPEWDGFRVTPPPGTLPPPAAHERASLPPTTSRPMVTSADCVPACSVAEFHERWECEFLATTDEEWENLN